MPTFPPFHFSGFWVHTRFIVVRYCGDAITKNIAKTTLKHTDNATGKKQRTFVLKLFLGTAEQYQNALAAEKDKSSFWHLTTLRGGKGKKGLRALRGIENYSKTK